MELKEFIKNVLTDVVEAVDETCINSNRNMYLDTKAEKRTLEFDIAVTVEDTAAGAGKAGIKIFKFIEGGGEVSKEIKNSSVNRIKFGIYIDKYTKQQNEVMDMECHRLNSGNDFR